MTNSTRTYPTFADRMRAFRRSLDGEGHELSTAALGRAFGAPRHTWAEWERRLNQPDFPAAHWRRRMRADVRQVLNCLELGGPKDVEDTWRGVEAFFRGQTDKLPWSSPPAWKEGRCPVERYGREPGSVVVGEVEVIPPSRQSPRAGPLTQAAAPAPRAPLVADPNAPAVMDAILAAVQAGRMQAAAAGETLRALFGIGAYNHDKHWAPTGASA